MRAHRRQRRAAARQGIVAGHGPDLEFVEGHVGLICLDLVGGEGETELENLCFLRVEGKRVSQSTELKGAGEGAGRGENILV